MPWQSSYREEVDTARTFGAEAQEKLAYPVAGSDNLIIFEADGKAARLIASYGSLLC